MNRSYNFDDSHRMSLDEVCAASGLMPLAKKNVGPSGGNARATRNVGRISRTRC